MLTTVAVLSDVHGVLPALDAVLAEPDVRAADAIVVTGDLAAGPQPVDVLTRLMALGERAFLVRGNADREMVGLATGSQGGMPPEDPRAVIAWAAGQLVPEHVDVLADLPHPVTIEIVGFGPVVFCHGTPRDDDEVVLVDTRMNKWQEVLADLPDAVRTVVCGHTHMPFVRLVGYRTVVNPGSVGMPYGGTGVPWALLSSGGVTLRRTSIDPERLAAKIVANSTYPGVMQWVRDYVLERPSDAEALEVFGPRDGRPTPMP